MAGGFCEGVEQAARFLRIKGTVLPAATESLTLVVRYADGTVTRGESVVHDVGKRVSRVAVEPEGVPAPPGVIEAIEKADVLVLGPGSLFTSTIPALLGCGVRGALAAFDGPVVYVSNVMTQPGETGGFAVSDHVRAISEHLGPVVTDVLVHRGDISPGVLARYEAEEAAPVASDLGRCGAWACGSAPRTCSPATTGPGCATTRIAWRRRCAGLPSFASEVRRQLAAGPGTGPGRRSRPELAGLVDAAGEWDESGVTLRTPSAAVARSAVRLWRSEFGLEPRLYPTEPTASGGPGTP
jgi:hypothetical protein